MPEQAEDSIVFKFKADTTEVVQSLNDVQKQIQVFDEEGTSKIFDTLNTVSLMFSGVSKSANGFPGAGLAMTKTDGIGDLSFMPQVMQNYMTAMMTTVKNQISQLTNTVWNDANIDNGSLTTEAKGLLDKIAGSIFANVSDMFNVATNFKNSTTNINSKLQTSFNKDLQDMLLRSADIIGATYSSGVGAMEEQALKKVLEDNKAFSKGLAATSSKYGLDTKQQKSLISTLVSMSMPMYRLDYLHRMSEHSNGTVRDVDTVPQISDFRERLPERYQRLPVTPANNYQQNRNAAMYSGNLSKEQYDLVQKIAQSNPTFERALSMAGVAYRATHDHQAGMLHLPNESMQKSEVAKALGYLYRDILIPSLEGAPQHYVPVTTKDGKQKTTQANKSSREVNDVFSVFASLDSLGLEPLFAEREANGYINKDAFKSGSMAIKAKPFVRPNQYQIMSLTYEDFLSGKQPDTKEPLQTVYEERAKGKSVNKMIQQSIYTDLLGMFGDKTYGNGSKTDQGKPIVIQMDMTPNLFKIDETTGKIQYENGKPVQNPVVKQQIEQLLKPTQTLAWKDATGKQREYRYPVVNYGEFGEYVPTNSKNGVITLAEKNAYLKATSESLQKLGVNVFDNMIEDGYVYSTYDKLNKQLEARNRLLTPGVPIQSLGGQMPQANRIAFVDMKSFKDSNGVPILDGAAFFSPGFIPGQNALMRAPGVKGQAQSVDLNRLVKRLYGDSITEFYMPFINAPDEMKKLFDEQGIEKVREAYRKAGKTDQFKNDFLNILDYDALMTDSVLKSDVYKQFKTNTGAQNFFQNTLDLIGGLRIAKTASDFITKQTSLGSQMSQMIELTGEEAENNNAMWDEYINRLKNDQTFAVKKIFPDKNNPVHARMQNDPGLIWKDPLARKELISAINTARISQMRGELFGDGNLMMAMASANPAESIMHFGQKNGLRIADQQLANALTLRDGDIAFGSIQGERKVSGGRWPASWTEQFWLNQVDDFLTAAKEFGLADDVAYMKANTIFKMGGGDVDGDTIQMLRGALADLVYRSQKKQQERLGDYVGPDLKPDDIVINRAQNESDFADLLYRQVAQSIQLGAVSNAADALSQGNWNDKVWLKTTGIAGIDLRKLYDIDSTFMKTGILGDWTQAANNARHMGRPFSSVFKDLLGVIETNDFSKLGNFSEINFPSIYHAQTISMLNSLARNPISSEAVQTLIRAQNNLQGIPEMLESGDPVKEAQAKFLQTNNNIFSSFFGRAQVLADEDLVDLKAKLVSWNAALNRAGEDIDLTDKRKEELQANRREYNKQLARVNFASAFAPTTRRVNKGIGYADLIVNGRQTNEVSRFDSNFLEGEEEQRRLYDVASLKAATTAGSNPIVVNAMQQAAKNALIAEYVKKADEGWTRNGYSWNQLKLFEEDAEEWYKRYVKKKWPENTDTQDTLMGKAFHSTAQLWGNRRMINNEDYGTPEEFEKVFLQQLMSNQKFIPHSFTPTGRSEHPIQDYAQYNLYSDQDIEAYKDIIENNKGLHLTEGAIKKFKSAVQSVRALPEFLKDEKILGVEVPVSPNLGQQKGNPSLPIRTQGSIDVVSQTKAGDIVNTDFKVAEDDTVKKGHIVPTQKGQVVFYAHGNNAKRGRIVSYGIEGNPLATSEFSIGETEINDVIPRLQHDVDRIQRFAAAGGDFDMLRNMLTPFSGSALDNISDMSYRELKEKEDKATERLIKEAQEEERAASRAELLKNTGLSMAKAMALQNDVTTYMSEMNQLESKFRSVVSKKDDKSSKGSWEIDKFRIGELYKRKRDELRTRGLDDDDLADLDYAHEEAEKEYERALRVSAVQDVKSFNEKLTLKQTDNGISNIVDELNALKTSADNATSAYRALKEEVDLKGDNATEEDTKTLELAGKEIENLDSNLQSYYGLMRKRSSVYLDNAVSKALDLSLSDNQIAENTALNKQIEVIKTKNGLKLLKDHNIITDAQYDEYGSMLDKFNIEEYRAKVNARMKDKKDTLDERRALQAEQQEARMRQDSMYFDRSIRHWDYRGSSDPVSKMMLQRRDMYDQIFSHREQYKMSKRQLEQQRSEAKKILDSSYANDKEKEEAQISFDDAEKKIEQFKNKIQEADAALNQFGKGGGFSDGMNAVVATFESAGQAADRLVKRFGRQMFQQAFREAKQFVVQFSSQMQNIQAITLKTDEEMAQVRADTISRAIDLKTSVSNVATVEADLYRQGLNDQQVEERTSAIIKFATVTGAKVTDAGKAITTAIQNGLVNSATEAMDVLTALGDTAATTANEIFKGMQKAAAAAKVAGVNYQQLTALLTVGTSKTQLSGQVIGTGLQTIFARMNRVTNQGYYNDETGATTTINDVEKALSSAGIELRTENKKGFRNSFDVLLDLSKVWNDLSDLQRSNITYTMAGGRQTNIFQSLMEGLAEDGGAEIERILGVAEDSEGTTENKYSEVIKSITASLEELKSTYDGLVAGIQSDGFIIGTIESLTSIAAGLRDAASSGQTAIPVFTAIGTAIAVFATKAMFASQAFTGAFRGFSGIASTVATAAVIFGGLKLGSEIGKNSKVTKQLSEEEVQKKREDEAQKKFDNVKENLQPVQKQIDKVKELGEAWENSGKKMDGGEVTKLDSALTTLKSTLTYLGVDFDTNAQAIQRWKDVVDSAQQSVQNLTIQEALNADTIKDASVKTSADKIAANYRMAKELGANPPTETEIVEALYSDREKQPDALHQFEELVKGGFGMENRHWFLPGKDKNNNPMLYYQGVNPENYYKDLQTLLETSQIKNTVYAELIERYFGGKNRLNVDQTAFFNEVKEIDELRTAQAFIDYQKGAFNGVNVEEGSSAAKALSLFAILSKDPAFWSKVSQNGVKQNDNGEYDFANVSVSDLRGIQKAILEYENVFIRDGYVNTQSSRDAYKLAVNTLKGSAQLNAIFDGDSDAVSKIVDMALENFDPSQYVGSGEALSTFIQNKRQELVDQYRGRSDEWINQTVNPDDYAYTVTYYDTEGKKYVFGTNADASTEELATALGRQYVEEQAAKEDDPLVDATNSAVGSVDNATSAIVGLTSAITGLDKQEVMEKFGISAANNSNSLNDNNAFSGWKDNTSNVGSNNIDLAYGNDSVQNGSNERNALATPEGSYVVAGAGATDVAFKSSSDLINRMNEIKEDYIGEDSMYANPYAAVELATSEIAKRIGIPDELEFTQILTDMGVIKNHNAYEDFNNLMSFASSVDSLDDILHTSMYEKKSAPSDDSPYYRPANVGADPMYGRMFGYASLYQAIMDSSDPDSKEYKHASSAYDYINTWLADFENKRNEEIREWEESSSPYKRDLSPWAYYANKTKAGQIEYRAYADANGDKEKALAILENDKDYQATLENIKAFETMITEFGAGVGDSVNVAWQSTRKSAANWWLEKVEGAEGIWDAIWTPINSLMFTDDEVKRINAYTQAQRENEHAPMVDFIDSESKFIEFLKGNSKEHYLTSFSQAWANGSFEKYNDVEKLGAAFDWINTNIFEATGDQLGQQLFNILISTVSGGTGAASSLFSNPAFYGMLADQYLGLSAETVKTNGKITPTDLLFNFARAFLNSGIEMSGGIEDILTPDGGNILMTVLQEMLEETGQLIADEPLKYGQFVVDGKNYGDFRTYFKQNVIDKLPETWEKTALTTLGMGAAMLPVRAGLKGIRNLNGGNNTTLSSGAKVSNDTANNSTGLTQSEENIDNHEYETIDATFVELYTEYMKRLYDTDNTPYFNKKFENVSVENILDAMYHMNEMPSLLYGLAKDSTNESIRNDVANRLSLLRERLQSNTLNETNIAEIEKANEWASNANEDSDLTREALQLYKDYYSGYYANMEYVGLMNEFNNMDPADIRYGWIAQALADQAPKQQNAANSYKMLRGLFERNQNNLSNGIIPYLDNQFAEAFPSHETTGDTFWRSQYEGMSIPQLLEAYRQTNENTPGRSYITEALASQDFNSLSEGDLSFWSEFDRTHPGLLPKQVSQMIHQTAVLRNAENMPDETVEPEPESEPQQNPEPAKVPVQEPEPIIAEQPVIEEPAPELIVEEEPDVTPQPPALTRHQQGLVDRYAHRIKSFSFDKLADAFLSANETTPVIGKNSISVDNSYARQAIANEMYERTKNGNIEALPGETKSRLYQLINGPMGDTLPGYIKNSITQAYLAYDQDLETSLVEDYENADVQDLIEGLSDIGEGGASIFAGKALQNRIELLNLDELTQLKDAAFSNKFTKDISDLILAEYTKADNAARAPVNNVQRPRNIRHRQGNESRLSRLDMSDVSAGHIGDAVETGINAIQETASDVSAQIDAKVDSALETVSQAVEEGTDAVENAVAEAVVAAAETAQGIQNTSDETLTEMQNASEETVDTAQIVKNEAIKAIEDAAQKSVSEVEAAGDKMIQDAEAAAAEAIKAIEVAAAESSTTADNVVAEAKAAADKTVADAQAKALEAVEAAKAAAADAVTAAKTAIEESQKAKAEAAEVESDVLKIVDEATSTINTVVDEATAKIDTLIGETTNRLENTVSSAIDAVKAAEAEATNAITNATNNTPGKAQDEDTEINAEDLYKATEDGTVYNATEEQPTGVTKEAEPRTAPEEEPGRPLYPEQEPSKKTGNYTPKPQEAPAPPPVMPRIIPVQAYVPKPNENTKTNVVVDETQENQVKGEQPQEVEIRETAPKPQTPAAQNTDSEEQPKRKKTEPKTEPDIVEEVVYDETGEIENKDKQNNNNNNRMRGFGLLSNLLGKGTSLAGTALIYLAMNGFSGLFDNPNGPVEVPSGSSFTITPKEDSGTTQSNGDAETPKPGSGQTQVANGNVYDSGKGSYNGKKLSEIIDSASLNSKQNDLTAFYQKLMSYSLQANSLQDIEAMMVAAEDDAKKYQNVFVNDKELQKIAADLMRTDGQPSMYSYEDFKNRLQQAYYGYTLLSRIPQITETSSNYNTLLQAANALTGRGSVTSSQYQAIANMFGVSADVVASRRDSYGRLAQSQLGETRRTYEQNAANDINGMMDSFLNSYDKNALEILKNDVFFGKEDELFVELWNDYLSTLSESERRINEDLMREYKSSGYRFSYGENGTTATLEPQSISYDAILKGISGNYQGVRTDRQIAADISRLAYDARNNEDLSDEERIQMFDAQMRQMFEDERWAENGGFTSFLDNNQQIKDLFARWRSGDITSDTFLSGLAESGPMAAFNNEDPFIRFLPIMKQFMGEGFMHGEFNWNLSGLMDYMGDEKNADFTEYITSLSGMGEVLLSAGEDTERFQNAQRDLARTLRAESVRANKEYGDSSDEVANNIEQLYGDAKTATNAIKNMNSQLSAISKNTWARNNYRQGKRDSETLSQISQLTGFDTAFLKDKNNEGIIEQMLKASEEQDETAIEEYANAGAKTLSESLTQHISDLTIDGAPIGITLDSGPISMDISEVEGKLGSYLDQTTAQLVAMLQAFGVEGKLNVQQVGDAVRAWFDVTSLGKGSKGGGGGGGGGGKSAAQKMMEEIKRQKQLRDHEIKMIQYQETKYANAGELGNENRMIELENEAQKRLIKTLEEAIEKTKAQMAQTKKGTDDWYSLYESVLQYEEGIEEATQAIEDNTRKMKENEKAILKTRTDLEQSVLQEIETRKQRERDMLAGTVSMQEIVVEAIRQRYRDEWELVKKDIEKKKQALEEEKSLIDERLQRRKDAEDEAEKYEELSEYKKQLALIQMDSSRTKDAAKLREKIAELEKDLAWDTAQDEAEYQKEQIDDQITAYDDFVQYGEEDLEDWLADASHFADEVSNVLKMSEEALLNWLKANIKEYALALEETQQQMIQGWTDTFEQMHGITHTYWEEIAAILSGEEGYVKYMKQSQEYIDASESERELLERGWREMYQDYVAAQKRDAVYKHTDEQLSGTGQSEKKGSGSGGGTGDASATGKYGVKYGSYTWSSKYETEQAAEAAIQAAMKKTGESRDKYQIIRPTEPIKTQDKKSAEEIKESVQEVFWTEDSLKLLQEYFKAQDRGATYSHYSEGGLVNYTGPAWVDGTPLKPEAFLDAEDTSLIRSFLDEARFARYRSTVSNIDSNSFNGNSQNIGELVINITEAQFKEDADFDEVAKRVGQKFVKELSKQGFNTMTYSF